MVLKFEPIYEGSINNATRLVYSAAAGSQDDFIRSGINITDSVVRIPEVVLFNGIVHTVREIGCNVFEKFSKMQELYIPRTVIDIEWSFYNCRRLQDIHVDKDNEFYKDIYGVLYTKDGKTLIAVPNARCSYSIPKGVEKIASFALKTSNIENLTIPETVVEIGHDVFYRCPRLNEIRLPNSLKKIGEVEYDTSAIFIYRGGRYTSAEIIDVVNRNRQQIE